MEYVKKLINYFSENLILTAIVGGCVLLILIVIIALCVKSSKAKKRAKAQAAQAAAQKSAVKETVAAPAPKAEVAQPAPATKAEEVKPVPAPKATETASESTPKAEIKPSEETPVIAEKAVEAPAATPKTETKPAAKKKTSPAPKKTVKTEEKTIQTAPAPTEEKKTEKQTPPEKRAAAPATAAKKTTAPSKKTTKAKDEKVRLEELKDVPVEDESNVFDDENENDKVARYSGKWVICRVMTAIGGEHSDRTTGEEMYFFELRVSNGEKLLTSEEYTSYSGALSGITTHKNNIAKGNFKIMPSKKGDYIFKLLSGKNMLLCMGENYPTKARCESAIESAKRFAATAIIDENVQDIIINAPTEDEDDAPVYVDNGYNGKWIIRAQTAADGEQVFYFELYASNGEKLLSSEEYTTYIGAVNGIETHKTNIERGNFRVSLTKRGDYIYKLLNGNNQLLCLGEHYKTRRRCESAIESVRRFAKNAPVLADNETVTKHS